MTEYTENVETIEQMQAENIDATDASGVKNETDEKTYTQADVDNIVRNRLARERNKKKAPEVKQEDEKTLDQRISEDMEWFDKNVGGDFERFIKSDEFRDFIEGTALDVRGGMEKFVKFKGADYVKSNFKRGTSYASTGSAKDSGASKLKEYYSPEDVDNLSAKDYDDPEIMKRVRQSMMKWK